MLFGKLIMSKYLLGAAPFKQSKWNSILRTGEQKMDQSEARANDTGGLAIGDVCLQIIYPSIRETKLNSKLMWEIAKRWNTYAKLIDFLESSEYVFNCAILRTPTGEVRDECTRLNIDRMLFLEESKPVVEEKDDRQTR